MGAMADRDDWEIGEDVYTPGIAGDSLRSLEDPSKQGNPDHYRTATQEQRIMAESISIRPFTIKQLIFLQKEACTTVYRLKGLGVKQVNKFTIGL